LEFVNLSTLLIIRQATDRKEVAMRKVFIVMVLLPLLTFSLFAQVTGKISGRVIDSQTGEPLPGANVLILGTTMGAASDPEATILL